METKTEHEIIQQFSEFMITYEKDLIDFCERGDVFFKNYLAVLTGSSDEKHSKWYIEFSKVELMCKNLKKFSFASRMDNNFKVSTMIREFMKLGQIKNDVLLYNKRVETLNSCAKYLDDIRENLVRNVLVYWNDQKFELRVDDYLDYFESVVAVERIGKDNGVIMRDYLKDMKNMFQGYRKMSFGRYEKIKISMEVDGPEVLPENPCPLLIDGTKPLAKIPIVPNANMSSETLEENGRTIQVINTCGFSSILHILLASIIEDSCYASRIESSPTREVELLLKLKAGQEDASMLVKKYLASTRGVSAKQTSSGVYRLNLMLGITEIWNTCFESLHCGKFPACPSRQEAFQHIMFIRHDKKLDNQDVDPQTLGHYVRSKLLETESNHTIKCSSCKPNHQIPVQLGDQLFIDVGNVGRSSTLLEFEARLSFLGQDFRLAGVVKHEADSAHFVALVRRINGFWELYDDERDDFEKIDDLDREFSAVAIIYIRN